jgi:hypothetical protein
MKNCLTQGGFLFMVGVSLLFSSGCNSGSGSNTEDKVVFNQEAFDKQIQGVYEYLGPNQGLAANLENNFIFIFGDSDTTMVCQIGTYTTTGDTVIYTTRFATNPDLVVEKTDKLTISRQFKLTTI